MNQRDHYHHGDLRTTLIAEGLKQLEEGVDAVSLRALAKAAGVSPNAPYRHFADKSALMAALAAEGFLRWAAAMVEASAGPALEALRRQGGVYLDFAHAHPGLYRLMFSPLGYSLHSEVCQRESARGFGSLIETSARAQAEGWKRGHPLTTAVLGYWSALHGWAAIVGEDLAPPEVPRPSNSQWLDAYFDA